MRNKPLLALACALFLVVVSVAQERKKEKKLLRNSDILLMVKNQFDDDTLIKLIEISDTNFDISGDALIDLKNQGVSSAVLHAMLEAAAKKRLATDTDAPSNASPPTDPPVTPPASSDSTGASAPAKPISSSDNSTAPSTAPPPANNSAIRPSVLRSAGNAASSPNTSSSPPADTSPASASAATSATQMPPTPAVNMGGMSINPQQMAAMQNPMAMLASMGLGGMFGGMSPMNYTAEQLPHVYLLDDQVHRQKHEVSASMAQIAQTRFKSGAPGPGGTALRSLATEGLSFAAMAGGPAGMMAMSAFSMASGFMPGMRPGAPSLTYVWGLPGRKSAREMDNKDPIFELSYGDIPGVDPDAFEPVIVQLVQTPDNYRLVGATRTKLNMRNMMSGSGPENGKWISEDRWPTRSYKEDRGFYVLRVERPLEPGEYAVVLRPVKGYKATPSGLGGHAQVFYSVWDFSVPGATPEDAKGKKNTKK